MAGTTTINGTHFARAVRSQSSAQAAQQAAGGLASALPAVADLVPVLIPRLTDADLVNSPMQSSFLQFVSDNLGNEGSPDDGFDLILQDAVLGFDDDTEGVAGMLSDVMDADFIGGDVAATTFAPITQ